MNRLQVLVTNKICPKLDLNANVTPSTGDTFIGTEVFFSCPAGFMSIGKDSILCRDDGKNYCPLFFFFKQLFSSHLVLGKSVL
jgi:hypothetical protein